MNKLDTKGVTYCVFSSGYTGRLVEILGFDNIQLVEEGNVEDGDRKNNMHQIVHSKDSQGYFEFEKACDEKYIPYDDETLDNFFEQFVFISDTICGNGTYYVKPDNVEKIQNILKTEGISLYGMICFKCDNVYDHMIYKKMLKAADFCAFFGMILGITIIEKDGEKIVVYNIDAESG